MSIFFGSFLAGLGHVRENQRKGDMMKLRPRRNRSSSALRDMVAQTQLTTSDFVWPVFVIDGEAQKIPVQSLPGVDRYSIDELIKETRIALDLGIRSIALFPAVDENLKDKYATEGQNPDGLNQRAVRALKENFPELLVITDVAMDPYSSDGHDGLVENGKILNDPSLEILAKMALTQARAGSDVVACSDMMDGRVSSIRKMLDSDGFQDVLICSYCIKYASSFYGPFRDALDSAPKEGDKKTYQMDPRNSREGLREIRLDEQEGADWLMVKPALPYLDVISMAKANSALPIAAYHVSGEYAMLKAASQNGWLDFNSCLIESLTGIKRAGADVIFTYGALEASKLLHSV